jgi:hypothetical protein
LARADEDESGRRARTVAQGARWGFLRLRAIWEKG